MTEDELEDYLADLTHASCSPMQWGWAGISSFSTITTVSSVYWSMPYASGHKYYVRWGGGADFETITVSRDVDQWGSPDDCCVENIRFVMPFTTTRESCYFDTNLGERIYNGTLTEKMCYELSMGDHMIYNNTVPYEIDYIINNYNPAVTDFSITCATCTTNCPADGGGWADEHGTGVVVYTGGSSTTSGSFTTYDFYQWCISNQ